MDQKSNEEKATLRVRLSAKMRDQIKAVAEANNRSMNAEIMYRLKKSLEAEKA